MSIKDMLVYLDSHPSASVRLGAAIEIAHAHRALLIGYYVVETAHVASYAMVGEALSIAELEDEGRTRLGNYTDDLTWAVPPCILVLKESGEESWQTRHLARLTEKALPSSS